MKNLFNMTILCEVSISTSVIPHFFSTLTCLLLGHFDHNYLTSTFCICLWFSWIAGFFFWAVKTSGGSSESAKYFILFGIRATTMNGIFDIRYAIFDLQYIIKVFSPDSDVILLNLAFHRYRLNEKRFWSSKDWFE